LLYGQGFGVLPRRLAGHDYETNLQVGEAVIKACFSHLMLR